MKIFLLSFLITTIGLTIGISIAELIILILSYFKGGAPFIFIQGAGFVIIGCIIINKAIDYLIDLLKL
jgi:hypothetical protein